MKTQKLTNIGLAMPKGFPVEPYESIHKRMVKKKNDYLKSWFQYAWSWNAVAYRFLACTEHDRAFTYSIKKFGISPKPPERYLQEKNLFGFFVTGLSTLESLLYSLYPIASVIKPPYFPIATEKDLRSITPEKTTNKFKKHFGGQNINCILKKLIDDKNYKDWKNIRNILIHRIARGRDFSNGGNHSGKALWIDGIPINEYTTSSLYKWLTHWVLIILNEIDDFTSNEFKNL